MKIDLPEKLKKARKKKGITLEQLAKKVGSSKSYMWQLETVSGIKPSAQLIAKIARVLDVTVDYLLNPEQEEMNEDDEYSIFFKGFKTLDENTRKGIMAQVEALQKLQKEKEEVIVGPKKNIEKPNDFTLFSGHTKIHVNFKKTWHSLDVKLRDYTNYDVCSACLIKALNNAISKVVAERLEGGEK